MNTILFRKLTIISRGSAYVNAGFFIDQHPDEQNLLVATKELEVAEVSESEVDLNLKPPVLVGGVLVRPMGRDSYVPFSQSVKGVVVGTAFLRKAQALLPFMLVDTLSITAHMADGSKFSLRVFGSFDTNEELAEYEQHLLRLISTQTVNLSRESDCDVWFDVANGFILSFDRQFINRVPCQLLTTLKELDNRKG